MRTTLNIADDVLRAAKEQARREKTTAGKILSDLARRALTEPPPIAAKRPPRARFGIRPFARRGAIVNNDLIDRLREDDAY
jgi:hypothetical protein